MTTTTRPTTRPATYAEALAAGWIKTDSAWERGYVSRKTDTRYAAIQTAGGSRRGEYYVLLPSWRSSQYCVRQYLRPA